MKLRFLIDENYLIYHTLKSIYPDSFSSKRSQKDIVKFQNLAWTTSEESYNFLIGRNTPNQLSDANIKKLVSDLPKFINRLKTSCEFQKILKQTKIYLSKCEAQWNKNHENTSRYIKEITALRLDKEFGVYITHPSLKEGNYIGKNQITWGHTEEWPNYITVYLWHEILHSYFGNSDVEHTIIELIADEELRCLLNKEKYPPFVGHKHLEKIKRTILPQWKEYLNSEDKDIKKFTKRTIGFFSK